MCRHLAYLGPPVPLRSLLTDPPHSLYRQAWAPRRQRHGTVNADGFGIGWYAGADPVPARYRRAVPIWGDQSLPDLARVVSSGAVLAAVRSATQGTALGEAAAAPFGAGPWLFSHNGLLDGWPASAARLAGDYVPGGSGGGADPGGPPPRPSGAAALLSLEAMVDSAFLWSLVLQRLRAGLAPGDALASAIAAVEAGGGTGRFNFLLTEGHSIAATACGDTLWYRQANAEAARSAADAARSAPGAAAGREPAGRRAPGADAADAADAAAVVVASEPFDDAPGWVEVPDRHLLTATAREVSVRPLAARAPGPPGPPGPPSPPGPAGARRHLPAAAAG
jgi:glutamine amidotransferase